MNDFFRSKTFKIIAVLLAAVLAFFLRAVYTGGLMPALSHIGGAVATPAGEFFAGIGNAIEDFFQPIFHGRELQQENEELQRQVDELTRRQADYDELKNQNDLYRRFFSISDSNADYTLEPATVIARVPDDPSGSFIINIGQSHGITSGMPVITENGLVGIVGRVSDRYCRVQTLMDPAVNIGVLDSATLDTGILTGDGAGRYYPGNVPHRVRHGYAAPRSQQVAGLPARQSAERKLVYGSGSAPVRNEADAVRKRAVRRCVALGIKSHEAARHAQLGDGCHGRERVQLAVAAAPEKFVHEHAVREHGKTADLAGIYAGKAYGAFVPLKLFGRFHAVGNVAEAERVEPVAPLGGVVKPCRGNIPLRKYGGTGR